MADAISPLMKNIFDDPKIANSCARAQTKTICCIVNRALKEHS